MQVRNDTTGPYYPDGAGGPAGAALGGGFLLYYYHRPTRTEVPLPTTERTVYPMETVVPAPFYYDKVQLFGAFDLPVGVTDMYLVYSNSSLEGSVHQIDVSRIQTHIEVV
jgi:hypothetical protein